MKFVAGAWRGGLCGVVAIALGVCAETAGAAGCPNDAVRDRTERGLPDCRAYEQVSPPNKNANDVGLGDLLTNPVYVAGADGSRVAFETLGSLPGGESASTINANLARRGPSGWSAGPTVPSQVPRPGFNLDFPTFQFYSPNLDKAVVRNPAGASLAPGDTPGAINFYLRDNDSGRYTTISTGAPSGLIPPSTISYAFAGMSADARQVLFESNDKLTPNAPTSPVLNFRRNLYQWSDGRLSLVTILPDGTPAPEGGRIGAASLAEEIGNAMSADGRRVVFLTNPDNPDGGELYVREDGQRTLAVSASQRTPVEPGHAPPTYWGASTSGSRIFFTSASALTNDAVTGAQNLYRFDVDTGELHNLTASSLGAPVVQTQGVLGISDDGRSVYFRDNTRYAPGVGVDGVSNIYLWRDGAVRLVATDDAAPVSANHKTYRMSPDGRYLVFQSVNRLTGYDNTDAATGAADSEVFRYDAQAGSLTCVSCDPSGRPPRGSAWMPQPPARATRNLQRGVTDDGRRVFFNSDGPLVPDDVNGKVDVYMWEDGQIHLITSGGSSDNSVFAGASATGDDVFFVTRERLNATDVDDNLDVYDARVNGGFPDPPVVQPCVNDSCQGAPAPPPPANNPASPLVEGDGNAARPTKPAASFSLAKVSAAGRKRAARTGTLTLSVKVSGGGILKASVSQKVGKRTKRVASTTAYPLRASKAVHLRLRLAKSVRTALAHGKKVRVSVRVSFSHVRSAKTMSLELDR